MRVSLRDARYLAWSTLVAASIGVVLSGTSLALVAGDREITFHPPQLDPYPTPEGLARALEVGARVQDPGHAGAAPTATTGRSPMQAGVSIGDPRSPRGALPGSEGSHKPTQAGSTPAPATSSREYRVTAYGLGCDAPGPYTFTESIPHEGRTVAGHRSLLGKWLLIDGVGLRKVEDVGGAVGHGELDLYMTDCRAARRFGVQRLRAQVVSTH